MKRSEQRRDHVAVPDIARQGITLCKVCGERVRNVYDRNRPVKSRRYWRHWRRS